MLKVLNAAIAIGGGVGGALLFYWLLNFVVERTPWAKRLRPFVFVGPAVLLVGALLVYPALRTILESFYDRRGQNFVGLENYADLLGESGFRETLVNNVLWIIVVPTVVVIVGLAVAALADRLGDRSEKLVKSAIFLPMAISFVGAATIWRFVYAQDPAGRPQVGILNAFWTWLGFDPVSWLQQSQFNINDLLLMVILIWLQAGFAMVLLSAGIKSVPVDTIEAARIDGANERQIFFRVIVPQIWGTIVTVFITVLILVMKIFDVVYVMTGGNFGTDVIGNRFFTELFRYGHNGKAAAIVVLLMLAVVPVMIYQVRRYKAEEGAR
mgnify:CR=1 FL=1